MKRNKGFTLIETLIYLGLFAILFGGAIVGAYNLFEGNGRNETQLMMQEEGDFLVGKINWAVSGLKSVEVPAVNSNGPSLSATKWTTSLNPIMISLNGTDMTISKSGGSAVTLNNTNVSIDNLTFYHTYTGGTDPESIKFQFTLKANAPNGMPISQDFSSTSYIRK